MHAWRSPAQLLGSGQSGQMGTRSKAWGSPSLTTDFCGAHAWACCPWICPYYFVRGKWYINGGEQPSDWKKLFLSIWCCTWKTVSFPSLSFPQVMKSLVKVEKGPCWLWGWGLGQGAGGEAHSDGDYSGQQSGGWGGSNACLQHFGGQLQVMEPNSPHYWQTVKRGAAASSLVDSTWTLGKTSPGGWCCPGQITQVCGRITALGELQSLGRKICSVGSSPAGTGGWTKPWRWLPASVFAIFFNILSSFYWNGNYFILTSYKSRLFLNIGRMYLLENSYLGCVAVENQVAVIRTEVSCAGGWEFGQSPWAAL